MITVEIINPTATDWGSFESSEKSRFAQWPVVFDNKAYQEWRLAGLSEAIFFGVSSNNCIQLIVEFQISDYETKEFGMSCGAISQISFRVGVPSEERGQLLRAFFKYFDEYRKKESIKFCFLALENGDATVSAVAQEAGFKYMLTWGSCFYDHKDGDFVLPEGFYIDLSKDHQNLERYLAMTDSYFKGGRFYLDCHFTRVQADQLYYDLVGSSFYSSGWEFITLFNSSHLPVGYFIWKTTSFPFTPSLKVAALRFLAMDRSASQRGLSTQFLKAVSHLLMKEHDMVTSGIEMHNLPSLKIHTNVGYRFNYIYSAYHSWN